MNQGHPQCVSFIDSFGWTPYISDVCRPASLAV